MSDISALMQNPEQLQAMMQLIQQQRQQQQPQQQRGHDDRGAPRADTRGGGKGSSVRTSHLANLSPALQSWFNLDDAAKERMMLMEVKDLLPEMATNKEASQYLQDRLGRATPEEISTLFEVYKANAMTLMTHRFGNYLVQKLIDFLNDEQKKEMAECMRGNILTLAGNAGGCRVLQKAMDSCFGYKHLVMVCEEIRDHVIDLLKDLNGNHVIQKLIPMVPEQCSFIIKSFLGPTATVNLSSVATHNYGCRVLQRVLENCHCLPEYDVLIDEIVDVADELAEHQYGNYVIQHALSNSKQKVPKKLLPKIRPYLLRYACNKCASNIVEKLFSFSDEDGRAEVLDALLGEDLAKDGYSALLNMMASQYGNYVVQSIFKQLTPDQIDLVVEHVLPHVAELSRLQTGQICLQALGNLDPKKRINAPSTRPRNRGGGGGGGRAAGGGQSANLPALMELIQQQQVMHQLQLARLAGLSAGGVPGANLGVPQGGAVNPLLALLQQQQQQQLLQQQQQQALPTSSGADVAALLMQLQQQQQQQQQQARFTPY